ncbi:MAG: hypothetical protein QW666_04680 [Candidatus Woesearchaeota archaeon]
MSKREIAIRFVALGLKIGRYAKKEIEQEAKQVMKDKLADKKKVKMIMRKMLAEASRMKAKLESYARAELKMAAKTGKKKKR